jgi:hypothetical protein
LRSRALRLGFDDELAADVRRPPTEITESSPRVFCGRNVESDAVIGDRNGDFIRVVL